MKRITLFGSAALLCVTPLAYAQSQAMDQPPTDPSAPLPTSPTDVPPAPSSPTGAPPGDTTMPPAGDTMPPAPPQSPNMGDPMAPAPTQSPTMPSQSQSMPMSQPSTPSSSAMGSTSSPGSSMQDYPLCSRTVTDHCMQPSEAPRGYARKKRR